MSMGSQQGLDIGFDFRDDTPTGKDPDVYSPTLRRYHQRLWSKPLPSGSQFQLVTTTARVYLHHKSELGEFFLASDSVIPTFTRHTRMAHIIDQVRLEDRRDFLRLSYTIGGMMVFPGNKVDGQMTINGARGCHPLIRDRFDLTVECVRRHYSNEQSPLSRVFARYRDFFHLFGDFCGFVEFFLLQDMVSADCGRVHFFTPFSQFQNPVVPQTLGEYNSYRRATEDFLRARNARIAETTALDGHAMGEKSGEPPAYVA
jgi:hypothetical protein